MKELVQWGRDGGNTLTHGGGWTHKAAGSQDVGEREGTVCAFPEGSSWEGGAVIPGRKSEYSGGKRMPLKFLWDMQTGWVAGREKEVSAVGEADIP